MSSFKVRLTRNAEDFDGIISDILRELDELSERAEYLSALEVAGIDEWEGLDRANAILKDWKRKKERVLDV